MGSSFHFHDRSLPTSSLPASPTKPMRPMLSTVVVSALKMALSMAVGFSFGYFYLLRSDDLTHFSRVFPTTLSSSSSTTDCQTTNSSLPSFPHSSNTHRLNNDQDEEEEAMTYITLSFGSKGSWRHSFISHNCVKLSNSSLGNNRFIIYTDNMTQPYCTSSSSSSCECRRFIPNNCPCPPQGKLCDTRRQCEKMVFTVSMLKQFSSFVFLDHDLLILNDNFMQQLRQRSKHYDFLASRTHLNRDRYFGNNALNYEQVFNSGLFFIRRLPGLNVEEPIWMMYNETKIDANTDQVFLSRWVFQRYSNWDELSFRWHCRDFRDQNIPFKDCYTLHDSGQPKQLLDENNFNLLHVPAIVT